MKTSKLVSLIFAFCCTYAFSAQSSPLQIKPGAWEDKTTVTTFGTQNMFPPEVLNSMPPESRKMLLNPAPIRITDKHCVKESDTFESRFKQPDKKMKCELKNIRQATSTYEADVACSDPEHGEKTVSINMHVIVKAESSEKIVSTIDMETTAGTKTHTETISRWLKPSCEGIKSRSSK